MSHPVGGRPRHTAEMDDDDDAGPGVGQGAWQDRAEQERWQRAAERAADRLREERGVEEPVEVSAGYGALWVDYGGRRVRVAGVGAEVEDAQGLFEDLDDWVAFDRDAGPGRVLDRDRAVVAEVLASMPPAQARWTAAVQRALVDLHETTDLAWTIDMVVHDDGSGPPWLPLTDGAYGSVLTVGGPLPASWSGSPREISLPRLFLECSTGWSVTVDEVEEDPEVVCALAAGLLGDEVVDELWAAWPACPEHAHPLEAVLSDGRAAWACPADGTVVALVGALAVTPTTDHPGDRPTRSADAPGGQPGSTTRTAWSRATTTSPSRS